MSQAIIGFTGQKSDVNRAIDFLSANSLDYSATLSRIGMAYYCRFKTKFGTQMS